MLSWEQHTLLLFFQTVNDCYSVKPHLPALSNSLSSNIQMQMEQSCFHPKPNRKSFFLKGFFFDIAVQIEELTEEKEKWFFTFLLQCSCTCKKARAFQFMSCLIYMTKHPFPMLIFCPTAHLSPVECRNSKLLTRWLQMPDRACAWLDSTVL